MKNNLFNRLWFQFSIVITVVVIVATIILVGAAYMMRPTPPVAAQRAAVEQRRFDDTNRFPRILTREAVILIFAGGILAIAGGVLMGRRMTRPLEKLAAGASAIGAGDLTHRVQPSGSIELITLANAFNQMAANLEDAEQLRQNLLADVAHELRTPLTVLQGNLRAILDDVYALDKAEVARLYDQTRHLNRLINDLHLLAQAEANQLPLHFEIVDANALVEATVDLFDALFETEQVTLQLTLPAAPSRIRADRARITQALQNLLTNALRYTGPGGRITVGVTHDSTAVRVEVSDTGEGIEAEHMPHVFDRFYRAGRARDRDTGGAGLGLALVKAIVETHGGQVQVQSAGRGQGSTFVITLPTVDDPEIEVATGPHSLLGSGAQNTKSPLSETHELKPITQKTAR